MREQNRNKNQEIEEILEQMDLSQPAPETEPMRQYWFMKKARELVKEQSEKLGRPLTACTTTFGCQMNARDSEKLLGSIKSKSDTRKKQTRKMRILSSTIHALCGKTLTCAYMEDLDS